MSEDRAPYDVETLKQIVSADQRSASEKERDRAVMKTAAFTAAHWKFLTDAGLPDDLVAQLTETFHSIYLYSVLPPPAHLQVPSFPPPFPPEMMT